MSEVFLSDNDGNRVCIPQTANPIDESGQTLVDAAIGGDANVTVVAGATYAFTATLTGSFFFGLAAITTPANIVWACGLYDTIIIKIPEEKTALHYASNVNAGTGYLRRIR